MAKCKNCGRDVGCGCNLDQNGLCNECRKKLEKLYTNVNSKIKNLFRVQ